MKAKSLGSTIRVTLACFRVFLLSIVVISVGMCYTQAFAEPYKTSFVSIRGGGPGLLYQPTTPGPNSHIGIFIMHPRGSALEHVAIVGNPPGTGLASFGYTVLGLNSTMSSDDVVDFNKVLLEVGKGVTYLKNVPGVDTIILLGHSGGGATVASYQSIAENGVAACQGSEKIVPCPSSLEGMPRADGLILMDSVLGMGAQMLLCLDPAVVNEDSGRILAPPLDMYNPRNGFHPPTGATYSSEFIRKYAAAQKKRMDELIDKALGRLAKINAGNGKYLDDEPFDIPGGGMHREIWGLDLNLETHTRDPHELVHKDGSSSFEIVPSLRKPFAVTSSPTLNTTQARLTTVNRFLSTWACRTTDGYGYGEDYVSGIEWQSTYNNTPGAVEGIEVPLLVLVMSADVLLIPGETIFNHAASVDKTLAYIEGATHGITPISPEYGNTVVTTVNYVADWLSSRF